MKKPATHVMQMTGPNTHSPDYKVAQNLSKYARKVLQRTVVGASTAGYSVAVQSGQIFVVSPYGLKKAFSTVEAATKYLGGML
jgi:ribulose-5-phosphate 4-epimerase/fuculose-1-phosphate aldolase